MTFFRPPHYPFSQSTRFTFALFEEGGTPPLDNLVREVWNHTVRALACRDVLDQGQEDLTRGAAQRHQDRAATRQEVARLHADVQAVPTTLNTPVGFWGASSRTGRPNARWRRGTSWGWAAPARPPSACRWSWRSTKPIPPLPMSRSKRSPRRPAPWSRGAVPSRSSLICRASGPARADVPDGPAPRALETHQPPQEPFDGLGAADC